MPRIPTITNHAFVIELDNMVENLAQPSLDETVKFRNFESLIQMALAKGFVVIATSKCKKDRGKRTISGLFSKPHCNF